MVDKGELPQEAATRILEQAMLLIDRHRAHVLESAGDPRGGKGAAEAAFRARWSVECSAVLHGLAVTQLIFAGDIIYSGALIEKQLLEALALREEFGLELELADSLNSLGSLKQKQHSFAEAERHYRRSL